MKTIEKLDYEKLWNSEHPLVYNRLVTISDKHDPAALHLGGPLARVKAHLPLLVKIEAQERGSLLSKKLEETDKQRDNFVWSIIGMTRAYLTANLPATYDNALKVKSWLDKHDASSIPAANYTSETERINDMLTDAERNTDIQAALATLNLADIAIQLRTKNQEFDTLFMQRKADQATIETVDAKAIRANADKDLRRFFTFVELYQVEYPELDYEPLVKELNTLLSYYKAQLAARAARRAKGAKVEEEPPIAEPEG